MFEKIHIVVVFITLYVQCEGFENRNFPENFTFGIGSSAYQIEGGWNEGGKGESIWDNLVHTKSHLIHDNSTGDVACNSYHLYKRDVEMVKELGVDYYRFSISWSRVLPDGTINNINPDGVKYYNNLINELLKNNIKPFVTLYHFDLPQKLQELGGWANRIMVDHFAKYADLMFKLYGDRVKMWTTINEAYYASMGYGSCDVTFAPCLNSHGVGDYLAAHHLLLAHAQAWHIYDKIYRNVQKGRIAMGFYALWADPYTDSEKHKRVAEAAMQFSLGWFAHPIFSKDGDYPEIMKQRIYNKSISQGFQESRLPAFTPEEIKLLKGSSDFFSFNNYETNSYKEKDPKTPKYKVPSVEDDFGYEVVFKSHWIKTQTSWFNIKLGAFRELLNWIKKEYNNPEIVIAENGYCSEKGLMDYNRVTHLKQIMKEVLESIHEDKCNITAYFFWALMDVYEWNEGYTIKFGIYDVDFKSKNRTRTPKLSAFVYKEIVKTKTVNPYYVPMLPPSYINGAIGQIYSSPINLLICLVVSIAAKV